MKGLQGEASRVPPSVVILDKISLFLSESQLTIPS